MTDKITAAFLALVRSGLHEQPAEIAGHSDNDAVLPGSTGHLDWHSLSDAEWLSVLEMARKQTVCGLVYRGVALLPEEVQVPDSVIFPLMKEAHRIIQQSRMIDRTASEVVAFFERRSLHPLILKGPEAAKNYPKPELRESGDLDLFFPPKEFGKAVHAIQERLRKIPGQAGNDGGRTKEDRGQAGNDDAGNEALTTLPDGSIHYDWNGIDIDQHAQYFDLDVDPSVLPKVPSTEATLLMLSAHILKHSMGTGIGLRQLCDMAAAYQTLPYDRERLLAFYEATDTLKWNELLAAFCQKYLGADRIPFDGSLPDPQPLMDIILTGGNFGHHEVSREKVLQSSPLRRKADTALRFLKRLPFSLRYAPRQLVNRVKELTKGNLS